MKDEKSECVKGYVLFRINKSLVFSSTENSYKHLKY